MAILTFKFSPQYVYRLITQNVADVYDYQLYENRAIKGSDSTFKFIKSPDSAFVEDLFKDRVAGSGVNTFEEWAECLVLKMVDTFLINLRRIEHGTGQIPALNKFIMTLRFLPLIGTEYY